MAAGTITLTIYFTLWYALNVGYNIYNKKVMNAFPYPYTVATAQLGLGLLYIFPVWIVGRAPPKVSMENLKSLFPIAFFHTLGHTLTVISLGAGAVSFTHIIKAAEPFFSTLINAMMGEIAPLMVNLALVPVVGGVALASLTELSFTWTSFASAMGSNVSFAIRGIFSKKAMSTPKGENMGPANLFAVLTIMSFLMMIPVMVVMEGAVFIDGFNKAIDIYGDRNTFILDFTLAGVFYYLYNEAAYLVLGAVDSPVTQAVGNTIKRVVILIATTLYFGTAMTQQSILGSVIAISGVLTYALLKEHYKNKAKKE